MVGLHTCMGVGLATVMTSGLLTQQIYAHTKPMALATHPVAVPSPGQLMWQDLEMSAMIGWNLQTICAPNTGGFRVTSQRCQASSRTEGPLYVPTLEAVQEWNPAAANTDIWVQTAASFGAKYIVIVADHMTGFTWWDTKYHNYSIANTKYKGGGQDLVRDMIASCKKYNMKLGFFYSVHFNWYLGVDGFKVGHPPLGPKSYSQQEYLEIAKAQLREIIELFGDEGPLEVWFDGGTGPSTPDVSPVIQEAAPNAICHSCFSNFSGPRGGPVRWMGNEEGNMPLPSWGTAAGDSGIPFNGNPLGPYFEPPSTDVVLREHYWFYQNDTEASMKTTMKLVQNYLTSVGRASNLILNIAPDGTGAIPAQDIARYADFGNAVKCLFSKHIATASDLSMDSVGLMDKSINFTETPPNNVSVVIREDQTQGQLINNYSFICQFVNGSTEPCKTGSLAGSIPYGDKLTGAYVGVGHKRIIVLDFSNGEVLRVRIRVHSHYATGSQIPKLRDVTIYDWTDPQIQACV